MSNDEDIVEVAIRVIREEATVTEDHPLGTVRSQMTAVANAVAEVVVARWRALVETLHNEAEEYHQLITRQGDLLTGVANALRGDPPPLTMWDHSDLPARAARLRADTKAKIEEQAAWILSLEAQLAELDVYWPRGT